MFHVNKTYILRNKYHLNQQNQNNLNLYIVLNYKT